MQNRKADKADVAENDGKFGNFSLVERLQAKTAEIGEYGENDVKGESKEQSAKANAEIFRRILHLDERINDQCRVGDSDNKTRELFGSYTVYHTRPSADITDHKQQKEHRDRVYERQEIHTVVFSLI